MKSIVARQIMGINLKGDREKDDYYSTPVEALESLLNVEKFQGNIFEPCCGEGHISKHLVKEGHNVESSDLMDRGYGTSRIDFLMEYKKRDNIITNPPYKNALEFAKHSVWIAEKKVALLLKITFLEGLERREFFEDKPPIRVWVFSRRISLCKNGDENVGKGMFCLAWFIWEKGYNGKTEIGWI